MLSRLIRKLVELLKRLLGLNERSQRPRPITNLEITYMAGKALISFDWPTRSIEDLPLAPENLSAIIEGRVSTQLPWGVMATVEGTAGEPRVHQFPLNDLSGGTWQIRVTAVHAGEQSDPVSGSVQIPLSGRPQPIANLVIEVG